MEVSQLYQFVLLLVLVGMLLGVGLLVMSEFSTSLGPGTAGTAINDTADAIGDIGTTWVPIIVIVAACAIILALVIRSFAGGRR